MPPKVGLFASKALQDKVLTLEQQKRRGWFFCLEEEESIDHCPMVGVLRELVFSLFVVIWVFPLTTREAILG